MVFYKRKRNFSHDRSWNDDDDDDDDKDDDDDDFNLIVQLISMRWLKTMRWKVIGQLNLLFE